MVIALMPGQKVKAHSTRRGYILLAIKAISVAERKKGLKNPSRYTTLNILVSSRCSSRGTLREASPLRCLSKAKRGIRRCPLFSGLEEEILRCTYRVPWGRTSSGMKQRVQMVRGPHHLPGCNLKREPTGTDVASSGVISTLLDYARILYTSGSPFTLASLSPKVSLLCTRVYAPLDIFDILTVRRRAPRG